jgi:uncharacterized protein YcbX
MRLSRLFVYPVKSAAGIELDSGRVDEFGLEHDRRWMIVDENGLFLTQRDEPRFALIRARPTADGLELSSAQAPAIAVSRPDGPMAPVIVWSDTVGGVDAGNLAAEWLSDFIGDRLRLVYMPDATFRRVDPDYSPTARRVSFTDGFPFLLISQESMDELNRRLEQPLGIERFRPNLVVSGAAHPHAEDEWKHVRIGDIEFSVVKPCARCAIPTVDPRTAERGKEPSRTLATYRKRNGKVYFGQNVIHENVGRLSVGDTATVRPD